jgi:hypothetical protein
VIGHEATAIQIVLKATLLGLRVQLPVQTGIAFSAESRFEKVDIVDK